MELEAYKKKKNKKTKKIISSIFIWTGIIILAGLFIDAIRSPMMEYDWGFYNEKLIIISIIMIGFFTIKSFFDIRKSQTKEKNNELFNK